MKTHTKKFETHAEYDAYVESHNYVKPNVSYITDTDEVIYAADTDNILTFIAAEAQSTIMMTKVVAGSTYTIADPDLEYSTNYGTTWNTYELDQVITLNLGDSVKFRGTNTKFSGGYNGVDDTAYHKFVMTGKFRCQGDITSLLK